MAHESKSKHKEIYLGEQKNVGVNSMEIAALNKREPVRKGLEVLHGTKERIRKETAAQSKTNLETETGGGLELVRGTDEVSRKTKETAAQNKTKPLEKAWNYCAKQTEVNRRHEKPQLKTEQSRWGRPGTIARNKRKSIGRQRTPLGRQRKSSYSYNSFRKGLKNVSGTIRKKKCKKIIKKRV